MRRNFPYSASTSISIGNIYCDGGVIKKNPSSIGGTWAWCLVKDEVILKWNAGVVTPDDIGMDSVTNNFTELLAAVNSLAYILGAYPDWEGKFCTDSLITLNRLTCSKSFNNVPKWLVDKTLQLRSNRKWKASLVKGHANKKEIESGWSGRHPTSKWNSWCDEKCSELAKLYLEGKKIK